MHRRYCVPVFYMMPMRALFAIAKFLVCVGLYYMSENWHKMFL